MPFNDSPYDKTPYMIYVKNVHDIYYEGDVQPIEPIILNNKHYASKPRHIVYRDNLKFEFNPDKRHMQNTGYCQMNGVTALLLSLPAEEPITNKFHRSILISYFGNGAKTKLDELKTPKAILDWVAKNPWEVLDCMGIRNLPTERPEAAKPPPVAATKVDGINLSPIWEEFDPATAINLQEALADLRTATATT
jgi:hypothetical protein